jgi:hypothetical protein
MVNFVRDVNAHHSAPISIRDGADVSWSADGGLGASEDLTITLRSTEPDRESAIVSVYGPRGVSGSARFYTTALQRLGPGYAHLSICRSRSTAAAGNAIGGAMRMRRCNYPSYVTVVP